MRRRDFLKGLAAVCGVVAYREKPPVAADNIRWLSPSEVEREYGIRPGLLSCLSVLWCV